MKQEGVVSAAACRAAFRIGHASLDSSLERQQFTIEFSCRGSFEPAQILVFSRQRSSTNVILRIKNKKLFLTNRIFTTR